jgi:hypothetical protein
MSSSHPGIKPSDEQMATLEAIFAELKAGGMTQIRLAWLVDWRSRLGCRTEEIVGMVEYLVETGSRITRDFSLDMHLVDAVIQCRMRREGSYDRSAWT